MSNAAALRPEHCRGAASELTAAAWFIEDGWEVFFPAIQQGTADFVVRKAGVYRSVQVKTATLNTGGYLQARTKLSNAVQMTPKEVADVWAIVHGSMLWVIPAEEIDTTNLCLLANGEVTTERHRKWSAYRVR